MGGRLVCRSESGLVRSTDFASIDLGTRSLISGSATSRSSLRHLGRSQHRARRSSHRLSPASASVRTGQRATSPRPVVAEVTVRQSLMTTVQRTPPSHPSGEAPNACRRQAPPEMTQRLRHRVWASWISARSRSVRFRVGFPTQLPLVDFPSTFRGRPACIDTTWHPAHESSTFDGITEVLAPWFLPLTMRWAVPRPPPPVDRWRLAPGSAGTPAPATLPRRPVIGLFGRGPGRRSVSTQISENSNGPRGCTEGGC